jgi:hypothetical protein
MPLTEGELVGMPRCGVPVQQDGTNVVKGVGKSPDAMLGDGNSAARCPYQPASVKGKSSLLHGFEPNGAKTPYLKRRASAA